ncbi:MAG: endonuclease NucS domain-containing protein [Gemmatimonadaceae bacterium]
MPNPMSDILSLRAAYEYANAHGFDDDMRAIREMDIEWDRAGGSSLRRGYVVSLLEQKGLFDDFKARSWPAGNTPAGERKYKWYLRLKNRYEDFLAGHLADGADEASDEVPSEDSLEFALEAHLRDFLARNLERVEQGLRLYDNKGTRGVEFAVDGGRIDLLTIDRAGKYVVIELKLSQGRTKALGQLLYYMGWVDKHLGNGPSRGIIIASEISDELATAVARVPGVSASKYRMTFSIEPGEDGHSVAAI